MMKVNVSRNVTFVHIEIVQSIYLTSSLYTCDLTNKEISDKPSWETFYEITNWTLQKSQKLMMRLKNCSTQNNKRPRRLRSSLEQQEQSKRHHITRLPVILQSTKTSMVLTFTRTEDAETNSGTYIVKWFLTKGPKICYRKDSLFKKWSWLSTCRGVNLDTSHTLYENQIKVKDIKQKH